MHLHSTGSVARVGPYHVITSDPGLVRRMSGARSTYVRGEWYYNALRFHPEKDNVCIIPAAGHAPRRAQMAPGYTGKDLGPHSAEATVDPTILSCV